MVDYCPECDSLLYPKKKDGKKYLYCKACGYEKEITSKDAGIFKITEKIDHSLDKTLVKDEHYYEEVYGSDRSKTCPRCGGKMILKSLQTRSGDEGMTHFWVCVKCNKSIRVYS
ncbi:MAG: transcription factor S [Promethearchaeota archaeon]